MKRSIQKELLSLFLIIVFPIHTWSIIHVFYNFNWIAERTIVWDAIGYSAYSLSFALLESTLFFIIISPIFFLLRKNRGSDMAKAIIGPVFLITAVWEMVNRLNVYNSHVIEKLIFQFGLNLNLRYRYKVLILIFTITAFVAGTIGVFPFLIIKYNKIKTTAIDLQQRLEFLSYLFLTLDLISISIIIIRNQPV